MTLPLDFQTREPDAVKWFIYAELKRISPYLKGIFTAFRGLNWGFDNESPEIELHIAFKGAYFAPGAARGRIFEIVLYTDDSESFHLYILDISNDDETNIAETELNFSDWGVVGDN